MTTTATVRLTRAGRVRSGGKPWEVVLDGAVVDSLDSGEDVSNRNGGFVALGPCFQTGVLTLDALEVGYRHIDTAEMYRNEAEVGQAVRESSLDRAEIFVTSKLSCRSCCSRVASAVSRGSAFAEAHGLAAIPAQRTKKTRSARARL